MLSYFGKAFTGNMQRKPDQLAVVSKYVALEINTSETMFARIGIRKQQILYRVRRKCTEDMNRNQLKVAI